MSQVFRVTGLNRAACPHPSKLGWTTKRKAKRWLRRSSGLRLDDLQIYRCICGLFHFGHKPGRKAARQDAA